MREQPFYLASFSVFLGIVGYVFCLTRAAIFYHADGQPKIIQLVIKRFTSAYPRIVRTVGIAFGILSVESLFFPPHTLILYMLSIGSVHSARKTIHSFWEFVDFQLFYHLLWVGTALGCIFLIMEVIIEYIFGCSYHICLQVANPNVALLEGLYSTKSAVRNQALLELRNFLLNEPLWRESLFREFIGDETVSTILCNILIRLLREYQEDMAMLNVNLKVFSRDFEKRLATKNGSGGDGGQKSGELQIFSPQRKSFLDDFLRPIKERSPDKKIESFATFGKNPVPDILELRPLGSDVSKTSTWNAPVIKKPEPKIMNQHLRLISLVCGQFAGSLFGRFYAAAACERIKAAVIGSEEPILWLVTCVGALIGASYEEDIRGRVQFALNDLLGSLLDLLDTLDLLDKLPSLNDRPMREDLSHNAKMPPSLAERRIKHITEQIMITLEDVIDKFADSLDQLKLDVTVRTSLRRMGFI